MRAALGVTGTRMAMGAELGGMGVPRERAWEEGMDTA